MKLCECGCGKPTRINESDNIRNGYIKGQPRRFIKNHNHRGKIVSVETKLKLRAGRLGKYKIGAGYRTLHGRLAANYPKSGVCENCNIVAETEYALIKGHKYSDHRTDYRELCIPCHRRYDQSDWKRTIRGTWAPQTHKKRQELAQNTMRL